MKFIADSVRERDMDFLIMRLLADNYDFLSFVLEKLKLPQMQLESIQHSFRSEDGESDVTAILKKQNGALHAILIEDKIDAPAMPDQCKRYEQRGFKGKNNGLYDDFSVLLMAPQAYLSTNAEAQKYPNRISYEEILHFVFEDSFDKWVIEEAIRSKESGYIPVEDQIITRFWQDYYAFVEKEYPILTPYRYDGPRGSAANWATFRIRRKGMKIQYKSDRGFMDLEIASYAERMRDFCMDNVDILESDMIVAKAGKSLAVRIIVPKIIFRQPFEQCEADMRKCLDAATRLQKIADMIIVQEVSKQ